MLTVRQVAQRMRTRRVMYCSSMPEASKVAHFTHTQSSAPWPRNTGRPGSSCTAVPPSIGTSPGLTSRILRFAMADASDRGQAGHEVLDERVEHADDHALTHRGGLAGDLSLCVHGAATVIERERHGGVGVARSAGLAGLDLHDRPVIGIVVLEHGDRAPELHRHGAHADVDLGPDLLGVAGVEHLATLHGGDEALEVEDRLPALV